MLKKVLYLTTMAAFSILNLQAADEHKSTSTIEKLFNQDEAKEIKVLEEKNRTITPGVLACDCAENHCDKDGKRVEEQHPSAGALMLISQESKSNGDSTEHLLACKNCE